MRPSRTHWSICSSSRRERSGSQAASTPSVKRGVGSAVPPRSMMRMSPAVIVWPVRHQCSMIAYWWMLFSESTGTSLSCSISRPVSATDRFMPRSDRSIVFKEETASNIGPTIITACREPSSRRIKSASQNMPSGSSINRVVGQVSASARARSRQLPVRRNSWNSCSWGQVLMYSFLSGPKAHTPSSQAWPSISANSWVRRYSSVSVIAQVSFRQGGALYIRPGYTIIQQGRRVHLIIGVYVSILAN